METADYFKHITGGATDQRVARLQRVIDRLSAEDREKLVVVECQDERTGQRFGAAQCRRGRAEKLGGGGRNRGSDYAYQVWAVWV